MLKNFPFIELNKIFARDQPVNRSKSLREVYESTAYIFLFQVYLQENLRQIYGH